MVRLPNLVAAAFAVVIVTTAYAHAAPAGSDIVAPQGEALTLTSAKQLVAERLAAAGQRTLHPGAASFDQAGDVTVKLLTVQGLPVGQMVVHPNSGAVTDAHAAAKPGSNG